MKKLLIKILRWCRNILLLLFTLSLFFVVLYKYIPVYYTTEMFLGNIAQLFNKDEVKIIHHWKPLKEISPSLTNAVIASEDYSFFIHIGFDTNQTNTKLNKGARSLFIDNETISQQVSKAVFLFPSENYFNKLLNTYFTILIEFVWGKERIIEVYLNSIHLGKFIYGAEAIAQTYLNKCAFELTDADAALIAACLINPDELDPIHPTTYILRRQAKILAIMEDMIIIDW